MNYFLYSFLITLLFNSAFATTQKLNVAVFLEPPYVDLVANKLVGENIDIINLLSSAINLKPVFIQCPPVRCLTMVRQGQADMILGLSKSSAREKYFIFLQPPYLLQHQPLRFFTLKEKNLSINSFSDLRPLLVGTLRGAMYFPLFDKSQTIRKVELTSRKQMVKMLLKGRIDTFLEREETVLPLLSAEYQNKFSMADYQYNKPINSYIAISRQSQIKRFAGELSQVLATAITDGSIEKIRMENHAKYLKKSTVK
ncbi:substrate-binding periplasmic protein [Colwellia psychrerythraea]|uniref:ABC-type transporter, periplasmic subunit family 3 n=1 Tax=Colwellia psychrerythraea TaxID=28229 RepID=A0A099KP57_COLPS|nr:transporter substrate-binding domain-containing protein [Colwellia psychrerythraea]KGJ92281.1 ABC-type transporter, periplasmic subunit family 3 [Colwellia psychrerythraea]